MKLVEFMKPSCQFRFVRYKDYFDMTLLVFCAVFLIFIINREVLCGTQRSNDRQIWSKYQHTVRPNTTQHLESIADKVYAIKTDTGIKFVPLKQNLNTKLKQKVVKNTRYTNSSINNRVPINSIKLSSKVISLPQMLNLPSTVTPFKLNHQTPRKRKRPVITYESDNEEDEEDDDDEDDEEEDDDDDDDEEGGDIEDDAEVTVIASDKHDYEDVVYTDAVPLPSSKKKKKKIKSGFKLKDLKKLKKFMFPLLIAYKLKFFTLIPLLLGGLVLIVGTTGLAGFFFALFAVGLGLQKHH